MIDLLNNSFAVLLKKNRTLCFIRRTYNTEIHKKIPAIKYFLRKIKDEKDVVDLIFKPGLLPLMRQSFDFIENIIFIIDTNIQIRNSFSELLIDSNFFPKKNNYIFYIDKSRHPYIDIYNSHNNVNVKFTSETSGYYGVISYTRFRRYRNNALFDTEKYSKKQHREKITNNKIYKLPVFFTKIKKYTNILWLGNIHDGRDWYIQSLNKTLPHPFKIIKTDYINLSETSYQEVLIENKCFCVLSLDGHSTSCLRDTELGISGIPNIKFTKEKNNPIVENCFYIANTNEQFNEQILTLKADLENKNYTKIQKSYNLMSKLEILKVRSLLPLWLEVIFKRLDINLYEFIEECNINTKITKERWSSLLIQKLKVNNVFIEKK